MAGGCSGHRAGAALGHPHFLGLKLLIEEGKQATLPAGCAVCATVVFGKVAQAVFGPFGAFIVQNAAGGMVQIIRHTSNFLSAGGAK